MSPGLEHDALLFGDDETFVSTLAPWLLEGLERGQPAAVATTPAHLDLLRGALGARASRVRFFTSDTWYRRPATTVDGWRRLVEEMGAEASRPARIVGEVRFGSTRQEQARWTRYESALNRAFEGSPAWIICPYDERRLPARILEDARRTHPTVWDPERAPSERYLPPVELFARVPEPVPPLPPEPFFELAPWLEVAEARGAIRLAAERAGLSADRRDDLVLAFGEVASNAARHGGGIKGATLWLTPEALVCEVRDRGAEPADPLGGFVPPAPDAAGGMGLWIARQVSEWLVIEADRDGGTAVRFAVARR